MNSMKKFIFILLVVFLSLGYSAILKWPEDCVGYSGSEKVCYHQVAMSYALTEKPDEAIKYCKLIETTGSIFTKSQMNRCIRDIAVILGDNNICEEIDTSTFYGGDIIDIISTKTICNEEVNAKNNKSKECKIAYILPIVVLGSLFFKGFVH